MAGNALRQKRTAEIMRRGGGEYLLEWILEAKSLRSLAADLDMSEGALRVLIMKNPELTAAVNEARRDAADAYFDKNFELIENMSDRRQREVFEALSGENTRDASEANVSQIDLGILKQQVGQNNLAAAAWNQQRYGNKGNQQININIGDFHLDALRKTKVIDHE
jgi:hypothetical protein